MMRFRLNPERYLWWVASLLLVLSTNPYWFDRSAQVVAPLHNCLLSTGDAWQLPLASWGPVDTSAAWPFWAFAICASLITALVAQRTAMTHHALLSVMLLPGLSVSLRPDQLLGTICVLLACRFASTQPSSDWKTKFTVSALVFAISVMVTLEFGIVVLILLAMAASQFESHTDPDGIQPERRFPRVAILLAAGLTLAALADDGFAQALFRPVNWLWRDTSLMPSMQFFSGGPQEIIASALTGVVILAAVWQLLKTENTSFTHKLLGLVLAAIGLGCGRYSAVTAIAICELNTKDARRHSPALSKLWMPCSCVLVAVLQWSWLLANNGTSVIGGSSQDRLVDTSLWRFQGPVMLTNPDHASDWQTAACRDQFPLLLDDRWDAYSNQVSGYTSVTHDMLEGLREFYLRQDGTAGGFNTFLKQHRPVAIVVDSRNLGAIRHLSVDPTWRVMSIDSRRTILGLSDSSDTGPQTQRAGNLFMQMEWPKPHANMPLKGTLALGAADDSRAVGMVLTAMRLPYAALRILPDDDCRDTARVRTWCYLELAHRSIRHTGQPSLLDQFRAVVRLRQLGSRLLTPRRERDRIRRALASLQDKHLRTGLSGDLTHSISEPEQIVRSALQNGNWTDGMAASSSIEPSSARQFYGSLLTSNEVPLGDVRSGLQSALESSDLPARIREEALFYCGCIELELRNTEAARQFFAQSQRIAPESRFSALRSQYLSQMTSM